LAGRDAAGTGLTVVEGAHWSERLGTYRTAGLSDGWPLAVPFIGTPIGLVLNHVIRDGDWSALLYSAVALMVLLIVASLLVEQVAKVQKRQRRLRKADGRTR
jgi:hypothetical protein